MNEPRRETIQQKSILTIDTFTYEELLQDNGQGLNVKECTIETPFGEVSATIQMNGNCIDLSINGKTVQIHDPFETGKSHDEFEIEVNGYPVKFSGYWMRSQPTQPIVLVPTLEAIAA